MFISAHEANHCATRRIYIPVGVVIVNPESATVLSLPIAIEIKY